MEMEREIMDLYEKILRPNLSLFLHNKVVLMPSFDLIFNALVLRRSHLKGGKACALLCLFI